MKRAFRRILLVCFLAGALSPAAQAAPGWSGGASMAPGSGVDIEYLSLLSEIPPSGCLPVWVHINNHSGSARTYNFQVAVDDNDRTSNGYQTSVSLSVDARKDGETLALALLPVAPTDLGSYRYYRSASIQATGYGVDSSRVQVAPTYRSGSQRTVFVGLADNMHSRSWGELEKSFESEAHRSLCGSRVDAALLPSDWRGLSAFRCLWLAPWDYASLNAGQKTAVHDWISQGGVLYLCEPVPDLPSRTEFGLSDPAGRTVSLGFGEVRWFTCDPDKELPIEAVRSEILGLDKAETGLSQEASGWAMANSVGKLPLNVALLFGFVGLFALLVGPVNLFYFARADRRHRLFWTTPAISLGASLLLVVVIILQDGFGGAGDRVSLTYLLPAQNKAVTVQEQLSRTGVLLSRDFTASEGILLSPVPLARNRNQQLQQVGDHYGGDWFVSRSLQAQRLSAVQSTRAKVQILNVEEVKNGAAPAVVSSLPGELSQLFVADRQGRFWQGKNVRTGERQTLQPAAGFNNLDAVARGSNYLNRLRRTALVRAAPPGSAAPREPFFCAVAAGGTFTETLRSIRWQHEQAIYLGAVTE